MFNRKQRQIEHLESEAQANAPYLEIAKEIRTAVGKLAMDGTDLDMAFTEAIHQVSHEKRLETARHIFSRLPVEVQWEKLHAMYGDTEIKEALERHRLKELRRLDKDGFIEDLKESARETGTVDLRAIPEGAKVEVGFFDPHCPRKNSKNVKELERLVAGRMEADGSIRVLQDRHIAHWNTLYGGGHNMQAKQLAKAIVKDHTLVTFGTITNGRFDTYEPVMYRDTALVQWTEDKEFEPLNVEMGYVKVNGHDLFAATKD